MFTPVFYIETIQNTKKAVANAVITDKDLKSAVTSYIDAQTELSKILVSNTIEATRLAVEKSRDLFANKSAA